jgi:hypothetical protein
MTIRYAFTPRAPIRLAAAAKKTEQIVQRAEVATAAVSPTRWDVIVVSRDKREY